MTEEQKKKFEVLYAKEQELEAFLSGFEAIRSARVLELEGLENAVVQLLEVAARGLQAVRASDARDEQADSRPRLFA